MGTLSSVTTRIARSDRFLFMLDLLIAFCVGVWFTLYQTDTSGGLIHRFGQLGWGNIWLVGFIATALMRLGLQRRRTSVASEKQRQATKMVLRAVGNALIWPQDPEKDRSTAYAISLSRTGATSSLSVTPTSTTSRITRRSYRLISRRPPRM